MKNNKHSCTKYWVVLFCWFFSPLFISRILNIHISSNQLIFGFIMPYCLFVIATIPYEKYHFFSYLRKNYPYEYKKLKRLETGGIKNNLEYRDFIDNFSPDNDEEWERIQDNLDDHTHFLTASFFAVGCFSLIYLIFLSLD